VLKAEVQRNQNHYLSTMSNAGPVTSKFTCRNSVRIAKHVSHSTE